MGTTGREWRNAFVAHGVSGRVDHGDRIERRVRFEHICVVFGVFTGGKRFVAILWSSCAFIYRRKKKSVSWEVEDIHVGSLSRETERRMMISLSLLWFVSFVSRD